MQRRKTRALRSFTFASTQAHCLCVFHVRSHTRLSQGNHTVVLNEALALCLADPPHTRVAVEAHTSFDSTPFALMGVIGYNGGHYTALSHRTLVCALFPQTQQFCPHLSCCFLPGMEAL